MSIEVSKEDLIELTRTETDNLPGTMFSGTSPLMRPFMKKLEDILPLEIKGRGESFVLSALRYYVDEVHADVEAIQVKRGDKTVEIGRIELETLMGEKYPTTDHRMLNLPGLLFLQSSPGLQNSSAILLRRKYNLNIPEGRRTCRYIFHMIVESIDAKKERIKIDFDLEKLPKSAHEFLRYKSD